MTTEWVGASAALRDWLTSNGLGVTETADGFTTDDGEVRFAVSRQPDRFIVHETWRDVDRGVAMSSPDWVDVERYLTMLYANAARARRRLRPLRPIAKPAIGPGAVAAGFDLVGDLDDGFTLSGPFPGGSRTVHFASDIDAAKFSRYVVFSADDLRERVLRDEVDLFAGGAGGQQ